MGRLVGLVGLVALSALGSGEVLALALGAELANKKIVVIKVDATNLFTHTSCHLMGLFRRISTIVKRRHDQRH